MQESFNPYQYPPDPEQHSADVELLRSPLNSLSRVTTGLAIVFVGAVATSLAWTAFIIGLIFATNGSELARANALLACAVFVILGDVLRIVGSLVCLATPREANARGLIFVAAGATILNVLLGIGSAANALPSVLELTKGVPDTIAYVYFLLYLRQLGTFIERQDLADQARSILVWAGVFIPILIVALIAELSGICLILLIGAGAFTIAIRYLVLIWRMRKAILSGDRSG